MQQLCHFWGAWTRLVCEVGNPRWQLGARVVAPFLGTATHAKGLKISQTAPVATGNAEAQEENGKRGFDGAETYALTTAE